MKTMTCRQLGGPCDFALHGEKADDVIKAQDQHLKDVLAGGDDANEGALKDMKGRWRHPIAGMGWYKQTKREFAALAEDRGSRTEDRGLRIGFRVRSSGHRKDRGGTPLIICSAGWSRPHRSGISSKGRKPQPK